MKNMYLTTNSAISIKPNLLSLGNDLQSIKLHCVPDAV